MFLKGLFEKIWKTWKERKLSREADLYREKYSENLELLKKTFSILRAESGNETEIENSVFQLKERYGNEEILEVGDEKISYNLDEGPYFWDFSLKGIYSNNLLELSIKEDLEKLEIFARAQTPTYTKGPIMDFFHPSNFNYSFDHFPSKLILESMEEAGFDSSEYSPNKITIEKNSTRIFEKNRISKLINSEGRLYLEKDKSKTEKKFETQTLERSPTYENLLRTLHLNRSISKEEAKKFLEKSEDLDFSCLISKYNEKFKNKIQRRS